MKRKQIIKIIFLSLVLLVGTASFTSYVNNSLAKYHTTEKIVEQIDLQKTKLTSEVIKGELLEKLDINILDIQFSTEGKIDRGTDSFFGLFKNIKHVKFYGIAKYSLDINQLKEEQVRVNENDIIIYLPKPTVEVEILEKLTEFKNEKGALMLSDVQCSPEEMNYLTIQAKENILGKALLKENIEEATKKAEEKIEKIISTLTKEKKNIKIIFTE